MRTFFAIWRQHIREQRMATLIWVGVMAVMTYGVASTAPSMAQDNAVLKFAETLPDAIKRLMGDIMRFKYPADVFIQAKLLSFMPLLTAIFGVLSAMGIVAREVERRSADFVLALPVSRWILILSRFFALACNTALLYAVTQVVLWTALRGYGLSASISGYAMYFAGHFALTLFMAALALAFSLIFEDYTRASRISLIIATSLFILNFANLMAEGPAWLGHIFIFGFVDATAVVADGRFPWAALVFGIVATILVLVFSIRRFERKQIPA